MIDRYTYYNLEFLEKNVQPNSKHTLQELFDTYDIEKLRSHPGIRTDLFKRNLSEVLITDFFGNVQNVEVDGDGQLQSLQEDLKALGRLVGNYTTGACGGDSKRDVTKEEEEAPVEEEKKKKKVTAKNVKPMAAKIQEGDSWTRSVIGGGALVACAVAWVASSAI